MVRICSPVRQVTVVRAHLPRYSYIWRAGSYTTPLAASTSLITSTYHNHPLGSFTGARPSSSSQLFCSCSQSHSLAAMLSCRQGPSGCHHDKAKRFRPTPTTGLPASTKTLSPSTSSAAPEEHSYTPSVTRSHRVRSTSISLSRSPCLSQPLLSDPHIPRPAYLTISPPDSPRCLSLAPLIPELQAAPTPCLE